MGKRATGTFEVTPMPHAPWDSDDAVTLGRMTLSKVLVGDLTATSVVEMLSARTPTAGSAGYVAIEKIKGTLHGRAGTFVLQHSGTMNRGVASLTVTVVPDSGTGELAGISGALKIDIVEKKHHYTFDYSL